MDRQSRINLRRQEITRSLSKAAWRLRNKNLPASASRETSTPSFDAATARRMAQASDVAYFIDQSGGPTACPQYAAVGFLEVPTTLQSEGINAALIGTTASEVLVAFRGTSPITTDTPRAFYDSVRDWLNDAQARLVPADFTAGKVHRGFWESLDSLWTGTLEAVRQRQSQSRLPVVLTGHSKGGALARLAALRLQQEAEITASAVFTYAAPRTGNADFARDYAQRITSDWRFENTDDIIPHIPPTAAPVDVLATSLLEPTALPKLLAHAYAHVGTLEFFDWKGGIIEGDSLLLHGQRTAHLAELAAAGDFEQITQAHSLEQAYLPKL